MKKLLLLALLFPAVMLAKFYPGTITFTNGSTKQGFIEIPSAPQDKLPFKTDPKGKTEKFQVEAIKQFVIMNEQKEEIKFLALKLGELKAFKKGFKIDDEKSWVRLDVVGKINIVSAYSYSAKIHGAIGSTATIGTYFYFWKPENDYCTFFYADIQSGGLSVTVGAFKALKTGVEINFEKECPLLAEKLEKDDIKKNGLKRIVELYEQHCQ